MVVRGAHRGRHRGARGPTVAALNSALKLSVSVTGHAYLLEIEGLFTQGSQAGRTSGESVGGIFEMESTDWSNGIRYHLLAPSPSTIRNTGFGGRGEFPDPVTTVDRPTGRSFALHELITPHQIDHFDESRFWRDLTPQFLMVERVGGPCTSALFK